MKISTSNPTLSAIFGPQWNPVRRIVYSNGVEMHMAHDICQILEISNVTNALKGVNGAERVEEPNRWKEEIVDWNRFRSIHFISVAGVYQLIMNNNPRGSAKCRELRCSIGNHLAQIEDVVLVKAQLR